MTRNTPIGRGIAHALVLISYLVGAVVATWPLATHITTHVTGDGIDDPALAWNLWWINFRLVDQLKLDIFHSDWMFHPIQINLGFYTLTPLNGLLSIPLQNATSLILANNLLLLSSFALGGYGAWLLTQSIWARPLCRIDARLAWLIAWLAGAFYAFAGAKLFYAALGQFNIASNQWIPFCLLYLWRIFQVNSTRRALRAGALAALFLLFQAWAELTYASFLILFCALIYLYYTVLWLAPGSRQPWRWWRSTQAMGVTALLFLVGIAPFLAAIIPDMINEGDFFGSGGGFADIFSADLMGYLVPTRLHPWLGSWVASLPFANDKGQQLFLGYSVLILLGIGVVTGLRSRQDRKKAAFWLLAFLAFWLLTLGPEVRWGGQPLPLPGPFAFVSQLPFFNGNRYPSRYSVMLWICAALLAARGMIWLLSLPWAGRKAAYPVYLLAAIAVIFALEQVSTPLPLSDFRIPSIYQRVAAERGDFALLELPTGWRNGARVLGKSDILIMMQEWYQSEHGKRRLGGNTSRNPLYKFQYFTESPLFGNLIALMNADREYLTPYLTEAYPEIAEEARRQAPALFNLLGIRYVTLHMEKSSPLLIQLVEEALPVSLVEEWSGEDWSGAPATIRLYEVDAPPLASPQLIDLASPESQSNLAEGWAPAPDAAGGRYAIRSQVNLLLPALTGGADLLLTYGAPVTVTYSYHGQSLGQQSGLQHPLKLPENTEGEPTNFLTLHFDDPATPIDALVPAATTIGRSNHSLDAGVAILARSAGEEVGDFAQIWVNGKDVAQNERGYNLVALQPDGTVLESASFDTMIPSEADRMATWLNRWQQGAIIAGAGADTVENFEGNALTEKAVTALQAVGVGEDLHDKFRWSHAFVGVAGSEEGSAVEDLQLLHPATVWLGVPLPATGGYGPLQTIEVTPH